MCTCVFGSAGDMEDATADEQLPLHSSTASPDYGAKHKNASQPIIPVPAHLSTHRGRLVALWVVTAACSVASGPVAAWPTLEPLLLDAGLWRNTTDPTNTDQAHANLDSVFNVATAVQLGTSLPAGWLYDRYGGRVNAIGGAIVAAVGLVLMSVACYEPASCSWVSISLMRGSMSSMEMLLQG